MRGFRFAGLTFVFALFLFVWVSPAQAPFFTFTFTKFNVPGAAQTALGGINNAGVVAGTYTDGKGKTHCFTYDGKTVTTIDDPNGTNSNCGSINIHGAVVGSYTDSNTTNPAAFLYENGNFTEIVDPQGTYGTQAAAINDNGVIVGAFLPDRGNPNGFRYANGVFTTLNFPGSPATALLGINNKGQIVGYHLGAHGLAAALYSAKKWADISPPNSKESVALGINNAGVICFDAYSSNTKVSGSLLDAGVYYPFSYPSMAETHGGGLNDKGMIAGSYQTKSLQGPYFGYIASYH